MSDYQLIRHCAPTLARIKTGSLIACPGEDKKSVVAFTREMNLRLRGKGLRLMPFRVRRGHFLLYVYRPEALSRDLMDGDARAILEPLGYPCRDMSACLRRLGARLVACDEFPHEIGLFLGYPPEDVYGFIYRRGEEKYCGSWMVYGDVDAARRTFARYKKCAALYMRLWAQGHSIEQLTVAV